MEKEKATRERLFRVMYVIGLIGTALYWGILPEDMRVLPWCRMAVVVAVAVGVIGVIGMCVLQHGESGHKWVWNILSILGFVGVPIAGWIWPGGTSLGWQQEVVLLVMMVLGVVGYAGQCMDAYSGEKETEM